MAENETETAEELAETAEEIAEEIAEEVAEETADTDIDVTVIEAPEPEPTESKFASVDVGDLHISGPAEMVESITAKYLKDHLDHNPHGEEHTPDIVGESESVIETLTPDVVQEQIQESVSDEIADAPPGPTDWLFRERG